MFKYALLGLVLFAASAAGADPYKLTDKGDYEASDALLKATNPTPDDFSKYAFYRGVNAFALNNKEEAKKWLSLVMDSFNSVTPTRYKHTAWLMLNDLETWKKDDLGDIERDMRMSRDRLTNLKSGEKTQHIQKEIVSKLDKLIKEQEDKANSQAKNQDKDGQAQQQKQGPGGQGQPAPDSVIMGGAGKGKVDEKELRKIAESWGTLPPAKRAQVVQDLTRELPPKFKPMIDEYFKALDRFHK